MTYDPSSFAHPTPARNPLRLQSFAAWVRRRAYNDTPIGEIHSPSYCPLAIFLRETKHLRFVHVYHRAIRWTDVEDRLWYHATPSKLQRAFILRLDSLPARVLPTKATLLRLLKEFSA